MPLHLPLPDLLPCGSQQPALSSRAQTKEASDTPSVVVAGSTFALTVTGDGEVEVKPTGFSALVVFYNDGLRSEVEAQNAQTEARLREAAVRAGAKPGDIHTPFPVLVGVPAPKDSGPGNFVTVQHSLKATDTARAMRHLVITMRGISQLRPLISALQSVGAMGNLDISYDFGDEKILRNQSLKLAVSDAAAQAKILEAVALPHRLRLVSIEPGAFSPPTLPLYLPLSIKKGDEAQQPEIDDAPSALAAQSVTLRYALADAPVGKTAASQKKR